MAKTIVGELKDLFVKFGGDTDELTGKETTAEMLDAIEKVYTDKGDTLPEVTAEDNGDVLTVVNGEWDKAELPKDPLLEKVYYTGDTTPQVTDLTEEIATIGNYYISGNGNLVESASNFLKKCDLSKYIPTKITVQSRNVSWYSIAFYNSTETFDSTTFISGEKASAIQTDTTFTITSIPTGALTMLVVRYSSQIWEAEGYEVTNDYPYKTVAEAIEQWKTDNYPNAIVEKKSLVPTEIYCVGSDKTYTDVKSAVAKWITDGKPTATIYVDSGEYITENDPTNTSSNPLQIVGGENRLTIVGESRESTIIKATTGKYIHPAIDIQGGNVTLKNLTFIADHSNNPNFAFLDPDRQAQGKDPNSAYAVHCDSGTIGGVVVIENCNIWSWQSCGLGCGTIVNSQIIVKNCDIRSFVPGTATDESPTDPEEHAKYVHGSRGAIVYHTSSSNDTPSNESFTLINTSVYLKGGTRIMRITNDGATVFGIVGFIENTFWNGVENKNILHVPSSLHLNGLSKTNNIDTVNSTNGDYSLLIK